MSQSDNNDDKKSLFDKLFPPEERNPKAILISLGYPSLIVLTLFTIIDQATTHMFFVVMFAEIDEENDCSLDSDPQDCEYGKKVIWTWLSYRPFLFLIWAVVLMTFVWPRIFTGKKKEVATK